MMVTMAMRKEMEFKGAVSSDGYFLYFCHKFANFISDMIRSTLLMHKLLSDY